MSSRPYYDDGTCVIYHGGCEAVQFWGADVLVTDPPYGFAAYESDIAPPGDWLARLILGHRVAAIFGYPERLAELCITLGRPPDEWVTWQMTNWGGNPGYRGLPKTSEHVAIFGAVPGVARIVRPRTPDGERIRRKGYRVSKQPEAVAQDGDVWLAASPGRGFNSHLRLHPNEKPTEIVNRLVLLCSNEGETIFDPYMGSGTTLLAAKTLGRRAIGVEVEERYCEIAAKRLSQEVLPLSEEAS